MKSSKISDVGEFGLIDRIEMIIRSTDRPEDISIDLGDDAAGILCAGEGTQLFTCDIQIENRHFRLDWIDPNTLGRRSMSVNLSDIAAMGGLPKYALVSLGLPDNLTVDFFDSLITGMRDEMSEYNAFIIGGNLSGGTEKLIIDITMIGHVDTIPITRRTAKVGDFIYITGRPGLSAMGFHALNRYGSNYPQQYQSAVDKFLKPEPRVKLAQELAISGCVSSMIDVSDGVSSDLMHVCRQSKVGASINLDSFPDIRVSSAHDSKILDDFYSLVLGGGEDYELLFTNSKILPEDFISRVGQKYGVEITLIGQITADSGKITYLSENRILSKSDIKGWDHFGSENS